MAYDEGLAQRIREQLQEHTDVDEKKMFGGLCFMVSGHMCCGIVGSNLMARVGPEHYPNSLKKEYAREMDFTGKPMKGMVYVAPEGIRTDAELQQWLAPCLYFIASLPKRNRD